MAGATNTTQKSELRCGWFDNPTPAKASLLDRDGEWIIGIQGEHQADGDWPEFQPNEWVNTNRYYCYGCACLNVVTHHATHEVERILSARSRPLAACRNDRVLKRHPGAAH